VIGVELSHENLLVFLFYSRDMRPHELISYP